MKKSKVTRELVNTFPEWSRVRKDETSIGFQLLNAIAQPMERMDKELIRMRANYYLVTANLDEIDILYKVQLPASFSFDENNDDPTEVIPVAPTVSGLWDGTWYAVGEAEDNDLQSFWYDTVPNRYSLGRSIDTIGDELVDTTVSGLPVSGVWEHHTGGGHVWVETVGGTEYLTFEGQKVHRGRIILKGRTRKGSYEEETLIFPWDMKQRTMKEWDKIYDVDAYDIEPEVLVQVRSADFNQGPYLSPWNTRFSENRKKVDEFWDLGEVSGYCTLDRVEYITDEWQQLVLGFSDKESKEKWELLDEELNNISGVDVALQPFQERAWVVTADAMLYCFDTCEMMASGLDRIKDKTAGSHVQLEIEDQHIIRDETITFMPWHARPLKEIRKYRVWYETPSGTKYGLKDKVSVPYTSDFWVRGSDTITRSVENHISFQATERGEYLIVLEAEFLDGETHTEKSLVRVNYKLPLTQLDLSSDIPEECLGIDFDSDQHLWVKTVSGYHEINLHYDKMLIDYNNKTIYFREEYDSVEVDSDG